MPGPTSHSYVSQRLRLHYLDWGNPEAPPLLLIHGNRDHAHNWDWTAARLQDRYHIIAPDLRGHGDSQWSVGSMYAPAEFVYDIAQLVHQQQLAPLRVVAHSLGGNIAMRYAGTFPEDVERLVVIEGWGGVVPGHQRPDVPERMRAWIATQRSLAARQPRRYANLDDAYQRMLEANPHLSADKARHLTIHGANQNEDGTYTWKFDNYIHTSQALDLPAEDVRRLWRSIACPVLLIAGSESWIRSGGDPHDLVADFADARHAVVDGAGHWVQHDQLDAFLELVEDFLALAVRDDLSWHEMVDGTSLTDADFVELLRFRDSLRRFLRWSEDRAKQAGLTAAQHQLLLAIRGHVGPPTIGDVADHLLLRHHSVVELVDRAQRAGLVVRTDDPDDHRAVRLALSVAGEAHLDALTIDHLDELHRLQRELLWRDPTLR